MEIPHADSADLYKQLREDDESRRIFKHNERQTPIAAAAENLPRPPANVPSTRNDWNPGWEFTDEIFDIMLSQTSPHRLLGKPTADNSAAALKLSARNGGIHDTVDTPDRSPSSLVDGLTAAVS